MSKPARSTAQHGFASAVMGLVGWLAIAVASGVVLAVFGLWRSSKHRGATPDVGPVSDGWLAEQRGRKDP